MIKLNLNTASKSEEIIKEYLENNASEILADKINNGVVITKDNTELINKKSLDGFMKYANEEAKKTVEQGVAYACIDDETVFGWAIHYFEEDSIIGELFTLDGEVYKPKVETPKVTQSAVYKPKQAVKINDKQQNLFDLMFNNEEDKTETPVEESVVEDIENSNTAPKELEEQEVEKQDIEQEDTGVVLCDMYCCSDETPPISDSEIVNRLNGLFGKELVIVR